MDNKNISDKVFKHIKDKIIDKTWKVGDKISSETQLAEELQVSRISVREAIGKLVAMNILTKKKGGGSYVNELQVSDYMDELLPLLMIGNVNYIQILEFRIALESLSVKLFIERANESFYKELRTCFETMKKNAHLNDIFFQKDMLFHKIISEGSNNPIIIKILNIIFKTMEVQSKEEYEKLSPDERIEEHERILIAIENKDLELAPIFMKRHLQRTINDLI